MKKALVLLALVAATGSFVVAEDLQEISVAIGAPDLAKVEQLLQSKKYSAAEFDQLIRYADEVVAYNDANFNKKVAGISSFASLFVSLGFTALNIVRVIKAQNDTQRAISGIAAGFLGLICLPLSCWNIYNFSKNSSNAAKSVKIAELLHEAKSRSSR